MYYQDKSDSKSKPEQQERFNDHIKYEPTTKPFNKYNIYRCGGFTSYTMQFRFVFSVLNS